MSEKKKNSKTNMPNSYSASAASEHSAKKSKKSEGTDIDKWRSDLSEDVLARGTGEAKTPNKWLNNLKDDSLQFLEKQSGGRLEALKQEQINKQAIEVTVDKIFACLQGFAYEFNKIAAGTDLHVSGTMSGDVKEVTKYNSYREAEKTESYFRARLSTRLYSLVIRGSDNIIVCFLMPVNHAMALSQLEKDYRPLATMEIKVNDDGIVWRSASQGNDTDFNSLEDLCAWLFEKLIEKTRMAISRDVG